MAHYSPSEQDDIEMKHEKGGSELEFELKCGRKSNDLNSQATFHPTLE